MYSKQTSVYSATFMLVKMTQFVASRKLGGENVTV